MSSHGVTNRISSYYGSVVRFTGLLGKIIALAWRPRPVIFLGVIFLEVIQGVVPIITAWLTKLLLDLLSSRLGAGVQRDITEDLFLLLLLQVAIVVGSQVLSPLQAYLVAELTRKVTVEVELKVCEKVCSISGLAPLEDPSFQDTVRLAAQGSQYAPLRAISSFTSLLRNITIVFAFVGVLSSLNVFLSLLVGITVIPQLALQLKVGRRRFGLSIENSPKERRANYFHSVLTGLQSAKEVMLFNLGDHFLNGLRRTLKEVQDTQRRQQLSELRWQMALSVVSSIVSGVALAMVVLQAFTEQLTLGDIMLYLAAVKGLQDALSNIAASLSSLNESVLFFTHLTKLMETPNPIPTVSSPLRVPELRVGIEFRNVSFQYSGQQDWVLRNLSMVIPAGQCLALVGLNGAGKTTLVKLLTRLYDPTEGEILWDGIDIRSFDPQDLRAHYATILQDFVHYELSAHENIGLGNVRNIEDTEQVHSSAILAGVHDRLLSLPRGYATTLSRWLVSSGQGADLSGGEWQKVAMARMFMRQADFLILDEPTAALDPQAEHNIYSQFITLTSRRTSLLITHRFSTVRMADVVAVLHDGRVTEYGSHEELIALNGTYAKLYKLQAERYQ
jgi:ATP-binding cassette subfamily B protein